MSDHPSVALLRPQGQKGWLSIIGEPQGHQGIQLYCQLYRLEYPLGHRCGTHTPNLSTQKSRQEDC